MQLVATDILGPLPLTKNGNSYLLVATDYFTRWVEAYPTYLVQTYNWLMLMHLQFLVATLNVLIKLQLRYGDDGVM